MRIVQDLAGYSLARADLVRRAMSKKKTDVMARERAAFVEGCLNGGVDAASAESIFDEMADFAKYAFNKSHAAAYALVGYQTAWLKYYYPVEFMAAMMTSVIDSSSKIAEYIDECRKMGITVMPPDINNGQAGFSVDGGKILFGLHAIKIVGRQTAENIVKERERGGRYRSLSDFVGRMGGEQLNKRAVENLIKAGAFDSLGGRRSQYAAACEAVMAGSQAAKKRNLEGQLSLFDVGGAGVEKHLADVLPNMPESPGDKLLDDEKEVLGIYVSGHPLAAYEEAMRPFVNADSRDFALAEEADAERRLRDGETVTVGGIVRSKSVKYTKNNEAMAFVTIEDLFGSVESVVFPKLFARFAGDLENGRAVAITGKAQFREDKDGTVLADGIRLFEKPGSAKAAGETLWIRIPKGAAARFDVVQSVLESYPGGAGVVIYDERTNEKRRVADRFRVNTGNARLFAELNGLLGAGNALVKQPAPQSAVSLETV
jgi:DNA polymerase-3 subunit alpha